MLNLNKLRLINWHLFSNETENIDNVTFLTGANGTGKSTIIDAIQIVLLGDTTSRNFNKAANDKSARTLISYLKGDTGESVNGEVSYLRPGRFSSYIVLQFYDDVKKSCFTLGVVFDVFEDETQDHSFFYINNSFPNNDFTKIDNGKERPCTIKEFTEFVKKNYQSGEYRFFESNVAYQIFLKDIFGALPDKYFSLFKKAVSFSPITNISSFITEFVCDIDFKIDIEPMKRNIEQYKILEIESRKIKDKITSLVEIQEVFNSLQKAKQDALLDDYFAERVNSESNLVLIEKHKRTIEENASRIEEIISIINEYKNDISALERKKEALLAEKIGSDNYSSTVSINAQKDAIDSKINNIKAAYQNLIRSLNKYNFSLKTNINAFINLAHSFPKDYLNENLKNRFVAFFEKSHNLLKTITHIEQVVNDNCLNKDLLKEYQQQSTNYVRDAGTFVSLLENSLEDAYVNLSTINQDISRMSSGSKPFSAQFLAVKNELERELSKLHKDAKVQIYCDLVDIVDKRWTKAIEVAIYAQKFNLFVNEEYFEEADAILKQIIAKNFVRVSLVDSEKLIEKDFRAKEDSVATVISTKHEGARAYTNYLLGNIYKCETFQEARECGSGLLPDCTGYRSYSTWYLNKRLADTEYIGTVLGENALENKKQEQNNAKDIVNCLKAMVDVIRGISLCQAMTNNECDIYVQVIDSMNSELNSLIKERQSLDEDNKVYQDVNEIDERIKQIEADIQEISNHKEQLIKEQGALETQSKTLAEQTIPSLIKAVDNLKAGLSNKYSEQFIVEIAEPQFARIKANMPLERIKLEAEQQKKALAIRIGQIRSKLFNLRSIYVAANHAYYESTNENSNKEFDDELQMLTDYQLPAYEQKIKVAHENAIKEFKDDFIYKLRTSIETVKSQIDELNLALKDVKFGKDSYRFIVTPNKDFVDYYNMITSPLLLNPQSGSNDFIEQYGPVMDELFSLISSSNVDDAVQKAQILQNIEKFTDYRTYLNFDLLVKRGNFAVESSLSRTFKKQSGGETQTPFYISILASFAQMYRVKNEKSNNTLRLVIFDEAFSKMDSTRIKEVVSLIKSFGLQAILSTPSEKIRDLANSVDLILVTMHDNKKARSYIDRYKEIK